MTISAVVAEQYNLCSQTGRHGVIYNGQVSTSPLIFDPYVVSNVLGTSFLDVGCGYGKWGFLLKTYRGPATKVTGVDLFGAHLNALRPRNIYDHLVNGSATALPFADQSFDSAVACEVLEHLPQDQGHVLISELKRVCRQSFVVTTPNYACLRGGGETHDGFNPYEAHHHNFLYDEFRQLGFTQTVGVGLQTPSFRLNRALASVGMVFPRYSRYLIGYWFADRQQRLLELE